MILRYLYLYLFFLVGYAVGHRIEVDPGQKECFFEALNSEDRVCEFPSVVLCAMQDREGCALWSGTSSSLRELVI